MRLRQILAAASGFLFFLINVFCYIKTRFVRIPRLSAFQVSINIEKEITVILEQYIQSRLILRGGGGRGAHKFIGTSPVVSLNPLLSLLVTFCVLTNTLERIFVCKK